MKPPFRINNKILNLVANISKAVGMLEIQLQQDLRLRKENRIKSIHSSVAIENNSLSLEQITEIINGKRVLGNPKEINEVKNAYKAYEEVLNLNPYSIKDFLYAHLLLTKDIVNESGKFRSSDVGIYADDSIVHIGARPQYICKLIEELFEWGNNEEVHEIIKSCIIHYEIENIHPFEDGNGRIGRLWQTLILSKWNSIFEWVPIETIIYKNQDKYYSALRNADKNNDSTIFIEFMLEVIWATLGEYNSKSNLEELNEEEKRVYNLVYDYMMSNKYITTSIAGNITKKSSSTIRRYFVKYLELGLIKSVGENKNKRYYV